MICLVFWKGPDFANCREFLLMCAILGTLERIYKCMNLKRGTLAAVAAAADDDGCWLLVAGCWLLVTGYWLLVGDTLMVKIKISPRNSVPLISRK